MSEGVSLWHLCNLRGVALLIISIIGNGLLLFLWDDAFPIFNIHILEVCNDLKDKTFDNKLMYIQRNNYLTKLPLLNIMIIGSTVS